MVSDPRTVRFPIIRPNFWFPEEHGGRSGCAMLTVPCTIMEGDGEIALAEGYPDTCRRISRYLQKDIPIPAEGYPDTCRRISRYLQKAQKGRGEVSHRTYTRPLASLAIACVCQTRIRRIRVRRHKFVSRIGFLDRGYGWRSVEIKHFKKNAQDDWETHGEDRRNV